MSPAVAEVGCVQLVVLLAADLRIGGDCIERARRNREEIYMREQRGGVESREPSSGGEIFERTSRLPQRSRVPTSFRRARCPKRRGVLIIPSSARASCIAIPVPTRERVIEPPSVLPQTPLKRRMGGWVGFAKQTKLPNAPFPGERRPPRRRPRRRTPRLASASLLFLG